MTNINTTEIAARAALRIGAHEAYKTAYRRLHKASEMYTIVGRALDRAYEIAVGERDDFWTDKIDAAQLLLTERLYEQEEECRRALSDAETGLYEAYGVDVMNATLILAADGTVREDDEDIQNINALIHALQGEVLERMANE